MNNPVNKWVKDLNRHLTRKDIQMKNKHVKRCSTSYVVRELPIKTVRYHYALIRIAKLWNIENIRMLVRLRDNNNTCTLLVGMRNGIATLEDILGVSLKNETCFNHIIQHSVLQHLSIIAESIYPQENLHTDVYSEFIHNCQNLEAIKMPFSMQL